MSNIVFSDIAWSDYLYWQTQDKKTLKRINQLLQDISRNGFEGIGKPEPLKGNMSGFWSRRIDDTHRLVYRVNNGNIEIIQCRGHYNDLNLSQSLGSECPRLFLVIHFIIPLYVLIVDITVIILKGKRLC